MKRAAPQSTLGWVRWVLLLGVLAAALSLALPAPAPRPAWTCDVCGQEQRGHRDEGCGRCEIKAADSISTAKLGGSDEHDAEAFE